MVHIPFKKGAGRKVSLSLYIIPGESPHDFFSRFYPHKLDDTVAIKENQKITNTLIGLIQIDP
jgi:hypothetical protein